MERRRGARECGPAGGGREELFASRCEAAAGRLCERVLAAGRRPEDFGEGLRAALGELLEALAEDPQTARLLLIEAHAAGGSARAARQAAIDRLTRALGRAAAGGAGRGGASPLTASFVVGGIVVCLERRVGHGEAERLPQLLPELADFTMLHLFPAEAGTRASNAVF